MRLISLSVAYFFVYADMIIVKKKWFANYTNEI